MLWPLNWLFQIVTEDTSSMEISSVALLLVFSFHVCFTSNMKQEITDAITDSKRRLHFDDNRSSYNYKQPAVIKWIPVQLETQREEQNEYYTNNNENKSSTVPSESRWYDRESNQHPVTANQYEGEQSQHWSRHSNGKYGYDEGKEDNTNQPSNYQYSGHHGQESSSPDHGEKWPKHNYHRPSYGNQRTEEDGRNSYNSQESKEPDHSSEYDHSYYNDDRKRSNYQKDGDDGNKNVWEKDTRYGSKGQNEFDYSHNDKDKYKDSPYGSNTDSYYGYGHQKGEGEPYKYSHTQESENSRKGETKEETNNKEQEQKEKHEDAAQSNAVQQHGNYPLPSDMRWWQGWAQGWHQAVKSIS